MSLKTRTKAILTSIILSLSRLEAFTPSGTAFNNYHHHGVVHLRPVITTSHVPHFSTNHASIQRSSNIMSSIHNPSKDKTVLFNKNTNNGDDLIFNGQTTLTLVGAQSLLIVASVIAAVILKTPNYGLGSNFALTTSAFEMGALATLPLFGLAVFLDLFEDKFEALQEVSKSTQRSVLALLGTKRKPLLAIVTSLALGVAAGLGEEMLFRGILQSEIALRFGFPLAITSTSIVFGALHAVTPLYAFLAAVASVFFGFLFQYSDFNLAVPIIAHGLYDVGALLWAHYTVTAMSFNEQMKIYYTE